MRTMALTLVLLAACAPAEDQDEHAIVFLVPGTEDAAPTGIDLDVYLRPQGAFGTEVDIHILGVTKDAIAKFEIGVVSADGEEMALQPFLPLSTARELESGCVAIGALPVAFHDSVTPAEVEDRPATLIGRMHTTPPATGELDVVLRRVE